MFSNANQVLTVDQVRALLGPAPLMPGESEEKSRKWWTAFSRARQAKKVLCLAGGQRTRAQRMGTKASETLSLRGRQARAQISSQVNVVLGCGVTITVPKWAEDYFGNDNVAQRQARKVVESYGITEEQIVAAAMVDSGAQMLIFDRMDNNRASASRRLRKAIDRRAEARGIPPWQTDDQEQDLGNREADSG